MSWTQEQILSRVVRYADLRPCTNAFIDARTPGSDRKENFTIIGPGVSENPQQHVHIGIPHGFNIGAARQPAGCVNSQHSHETAEVFVAHTGRWRFTIGENGDDAAIELGAGDTISIPVHVFRGFANVGDGEGFLFAVLGGDDPGHVTWAPYVFSAARGHGLILLEDGRLIDTALGETVPQGAVPKEPPSPDDLAGIRRMQEHEIRQCVVAARDLQQIAMQPYPGIAGISESPIVGQASKPEHMPAGRMAWPHGFHLRRVVIQSGCETPWHKRHEAEVLMMHSGRVDYRWDGRELRLGPGDVMTAPIGLDRQYANSGPEPAVVYVVRGGDLPAAYELSASDGRRQSA